MKFLILILSFIFVGCADYKSIQDCKSMGFKGIVFEQEDSNPYILCTDGTVIKVGDELRVITNDGIIPISRYHGKPFFEERNVIFLDFENGITPFQERK